MVAERKLYIQFVVGGNRFVLPAMDVVGIVPLATLHEVPHAPEYVAGILNYHGQSVPVIDMTRFMVGEDTEKRLSARIVLMHVDTQEKGASVVGLLAERVTEVMRLKEKDFKKSGVKNKNAKYLGDVVTDNDGMLQRLNIAELLPKTTQKMLFG